METGKNCDYVNVSRGNKVLQPVYLEIVGNDSGHADDMDHYYSSLQTGERVNQPQDTGRAYQGILKAEKSQKCSCARLVFISTVVIGLALMFASGFMIGYFTSRETRSLTTIKVEDDHGSDEWKCCDIRAFSYGLKDPGFGYEYPDSKRAHVAIDGHEFPAQAARGIHVIQLLPSICTVKVAERFDTFANISWSEAFTAFVNGVERGSILIIVTDDEYTVNLNREATAILRRLTSQPTQYEYRSSLAAISYKRAGEEYDTLGSVYNLKKEGPSILQALIRTNGTHISHYTNKNATFML